MDNEDRKYTKRDFLRCSLLGLGGMCFAASDALAHDFFSTTRMGKEEPWKWSKQAMHYIQTARGIRCQLCPNECNIKLNEAGDCRNRVNYDNKLYSIAYGNPCSANIDPIEKKPLYHFLPTTFAFSIATAGCNLACLNCQNHEISQHSPKETRNIDLMPDKVLANAMSNHCKSIAYTYSEPITFFEYTLDSAKLAKEAGIKNLMISAGYIHEEPLRMLSQYIDAANIDLKSFSNDIYLRLNGGTLEPILRTLKILKEEGVWLEITNLLVPGWTDDMDMIKKMCGWLAENGFENTPLHFSRFYPTYKLTQLPSTPVNVLKEARRTAIREGINFVYIGNVPGNDASNTYCPSCNELLIERKGYTITKNNMTKDACSHCSAIIPGYWN